MLKAFVLSGLIALAAAATLSNGNTKCLYQNEIWGSANPMIFYFCLDENTILEQNCPSNTFFVRNATACGCVPFDLVSENCISSEPVVSCTSEHLQQPQPALNPTQFYLCPELSASPVLLNCPENQAFVNQNGYLGCFSWGQWRQIRLCNE